MTTPTLCRVCAEPRGECEAADCAEHTIPGLCVYCCRLADVMARSSACDCYVSRLTLAQAFGIRYGAHAANCPVYRPSGDPVDHANDRQRRAAAIR